MANEEVDDDTILGNAVVQEVAGEDKKDGGGVDYSTLFSGVAELASKGVQTYQTTEAAKKSKADVEEQTKKAVAADAAMAGALATLDIVMASPKPDAQAIASAQSLATSATTTAAQVGAGLPAEAAAKRTAAANASAQKAAEESLAAPGDKAKAAKMRAWQRVAASVLSMVPAGTPVPKTESSGSNFFTKVHAGIPTWGWIGGGALVLTGGVMLLRSMSKKKR